MEHEMKTDTSLRTSLRAELETASRLLSGLCRRYGVTLIASGSPAGASISVLETVSAENRDIKDREDCHV